MPKKTARRIIDTKKATGTTIISGVTVSGSPGAGASAAMAGDGLTYSSGVLNVGAGTGITVAADSVSLASTVAGAGLTHSSGVLNVGEGTLVTVGTDSVGITSGANYQYIGTGAGTAAAWQNLSTLAGNGLTHTTGVLAVGVANTGGTGLTVEADAVRLTTYSDRTGSASGVLYAASGNLKLTTQNISSTVGYTSFTSGFAGSGWRVDYGDTEADKASAEFDNLTIRGRMRVYELLIQQIRATNGSVFVSSSSKVLTTSASTNPTWTVNGVQLTFNGANATLATTIYTNTTSTASEDGADRTHYHGFLVGDIIRAQQVEWDGSGFAGIIQSDLEVTYINSLYNYQAARVSSGTDAPAVGYDYVRLGNASDTTRRGVVYLTSDDDNAPFIDIVDGVQSHAQWNTAGKIRARLGRLDGITDAEWGTLSGYGLWSDNVYLTGSIYATDGIFNGTVYATDGIFSGTVYAGAGEFSGFLTIGTSGGIYQGTGTAASPTNGMKIFSDSGIGQIASYDTGVKTFRIGDDDVRYLITTDLDDIRTVKWLDDIDFTGTWSDLSSEPGQYSFMGGYKDTNYNYLYLSSRVNDTGTPSNPRAASIQLVASLNHSGTVASGGLAINTLNSTYSYETVIATTNAFLSIAPLSSNPTSSPASSSQAFIYVKGGKLVIKYNDGGTVRYHTLDMTGATTPKPWVNSTSAP